MASDFSIEYGDIIKAYQNKVSVLTTELVSSEGKLIASERVISNLSQTIEDLEKQIKTRRNKTKLTTETVDYNN